MPSYYYLEKAEGTLDSLMTSPILPWAWLGSKTMIFSALTLLASVVITLVVNGPHMHWGLFGAAVLFSGMPVILTGFALATRYTA